MSKKNNKESIVGQIIELIEENIVNKGKKEEFSKKFNELIINKINEWKK